MSELGARADAADAAAADAAALHEEPSERPLATVSPLPVQEPHGFADAASDALLASYWRLAEVFHDVLSEQTLDALLDRIADTLADLIPHDTLTIYEADEAQRLLVPLTARDPWADEILKSRPSFGEGITGWAVEHREPVLANQAQTDPRVKTIPGTPTDEPEALISVPLVARGSVKGALNVYRLGENAAFSAEEFELAKRFGDAAALALDNAQTRARLEHLAQTDCLTGLYNHRYFHERLRSELKLAGRSRDSVAVLILDLDDFKRVNDLHGHETGDEVLAGVAEILRAAARESDAVCRIGGEEFAVVMPSSRLDEALQLARRVIERFDSQTFAHVGKVGTSIGIAEGPRQAANPRELVACAEAAMMTAKARGKNQIVLFGDDAGERPDASGSNGRDVRSLAHLKMLQSITGKLSRLSGVSEIGTVIISELRTLIDYYNCRVYLVEGDHLTPIAVLGELGIASGEALAALRLGAGQGIAGRAVRDGRSLLVPNALECEYAVRIPGTPAVDESIIAVPLRFEGRVIGVIVVSQLGADQLDDDDLRLMEVLAGHASVALENARLYELQRREAEVANALLDLSRELASAEGLDAALEQIGAAAERIVGRPGVSVWLDVDGERGDGGETILELQGVRYAVVPLGTATAGYIALPLGGAERPSERDLHLLARIAAQAAPALARLALPA